MSVIICVNVFFFKQKTSYDMRISYWSSDVCSSDLGDAGAWRGEARRGGRRDGRRGRPRDRPSLRYHRPGGPGAGGDDGADGIRRHRHPGEQCRQLLRSEEHTSELQSLVRISYAVFCLTKKKKKQIK